MSYADFRQIVKCNQSCSEGVFCASIGDVFEDQRGPILTHDWYTLWKCSKCGKIQNFPPTCTRRTCFTPDTVCPLTLNDLRRDLFTLVDTTPWLDWLLLTNRPENVRRMWPRTEADWLDDEDIPHAIKYRHNVWLGTSISDQRTADVWVPRLLACHDLCPVLFLNIEPLLGPIDLTPWLEWGSKGPPWLSAPSDHPADQGPHNTGAWIIVGGESGPHARPCNLAWIRTIVRQCQDADISCFVKQLGAHAVSNVKADHFGRIKHGDSMGSLPVSPEPWRMWLEDLNGGNIDEFPSDLRVRQWPEVRAHA